MPIAYLIQLARALECSKKAVRVTGSFHIALIDWLRSRGYIEAKIFASDDVTAVVYGITVPGCNLIGLPA